MLTRIAGQLASVLLAAAVATSAAAQADDYSLGKNDVKVTTDEFTGHTYTLTKGVRLDGVPYGSIQRIDFKFQRFSAKGIDEPSYQIFVNYGGKSWMFIEPGESLIFMLDGDPLPLNSLRGSRSSRDVVSGGDVRESAMYEVTPDDLRRIANAKEVKVRIRGSRGSIDAAPKRDNFNLLRGFLAAYVGGEAAPPSRHTAPAQPEVAPPSVPAGMNWVVDRRTKTYYPATCAAVAGIPEGDRLYYVNENGPQAGGFKRGQGC